MFEVDITLLQWNDDNLRHITRHGVSKNEVDEVCLGIVLARETYRGRILVIGPTRQGRLLAVVLAQSADGGVYYPVTAKPASLKERRGYRQQHGSALL